MEYALPEVTIGAKWKCVWNGNNYRIHKFGLSNLLILNTLNHINSMIIKACIYVKQLEKQ
ncbi:hypothetical protein C1H87_00840 [Flavivirga eckloniae]|uniref:Uncharacterized protein n=1 Tax=Flavivirga eckloniae TaxID=1803846 RepID=A0A2K9PJV2_9FLAO|nr:hypothetical protein C1H87_00840 [Flavivirga eckloniae]